jgi:hypothetical protein
VDVPCSINESFVEDAVIVECCFSFCLIGGVSDGSYFFFFPSPSLSEDATDEEEEDDDEDEEEEEEEENEEDKDDLLKDEEAPDSGSVVDTRSHNIARSGTVDGMDDAIVLLIKAIADEYEAW